MLNILFVHQSAEMYGSDKVLLALVGGLDRKRFRPVVVLPSEGPLMVALRFIGVEAHVAPVVKVSRATLSLRGLLRLPLDVWRSMRTMNRLLAGGNIAIVHSNTLAVLSGALWAKLRRLPHVWHVHEMIVHPKLVKEGFPWLLRMFADRVACNSNPTRALLLESQPLLDQRSITIWNGMDREHPMQRSEIADFRHAMGLPAECVLVVLMGRINRLKGQKLLVEAAMHAQRQGLTQVHYLIVGSAPSGQEHFLQDLQQALATSGVENLFTVMDFQSDIWRIWGAADIAVLPSIEPESFGMVALEAMAAGKPVVAAAHGGPLDIVIDGKTGTLVAPNDALALADAIVALARDKAARERMGRAGLRRLDEQFSLRNYVHGFEQLYEAVGESRI